MRPRDRAALILVAIALAWACLAIGGAPRWAAMTGAGLALATAAPYLTSRRTASRPSPLLWPLAVMFGLTALQLVPLPAAIAEQVAPHKLALVRDNARAWGDGDPAWVMASYDPPATLVELAKLAGYLALGWTCARLAAERACRRWLVGIVAGVATLAALVTLAHHALALDRLYGIYTPSVRLPVLGPLIGVNHLASLLTFAVPLAIALALRAGGMARVGWIAAALALIRTALLTGSRGGVIGLAAGLIVVTAVTVVQRRAGDASSPVPPALSLPGIAVVAAAVVLTVALTAGTVSRDLARTSLAEVHDPHDKVQLWVRTAALTSDHRWLGVGKGAFEPAFAPRAETGAVTYTHAENGYLQALIDWGLPGGALLFITLGAAALAGARRWRQGPLEAGALAAGVTLAVHDVADFSIEMPAVAMAAIAGVAILFPARLAHARRDPREPTAAQARWLRIAALAAGVIVVALAASPLGRTARADAARVAATGEGDRLAAARRAFARHPADFVLAGRSAEALFARRDPRALKLIARALAMSSNHAGLHHLAARLLSYSNRPAQAADELRTAARYARDVAPIVADVVRVFRTTEDIVGALPLEPRQAGAIVRALGDRREVIFLYTRRLAELHPNDAGVQFLLANAAVAVRDLGRAVPAAAAAWKLGGRARHAALYGQALADTGDLRGAIALLQAAIPRLEREPLAEHALVFWALVRAQQRLGDLAGAKTTLERLRDLAGPDPALRAKVHLGLAEVEDQLGNRNQAEWERARARELQSSK